MAVKATAEITLRDQTDAEAIILWHYVSTSASAPSKPTTTSASTTPSGWSKSEPSVSSDSDLSKYDYTSLQTVWGDGTCDWGDVNLSASYEAAKRAWNKAGSVENQLNNLEIGGRNLLGNTENRSGSAIVANSAATSTFGNIGGYNDATSLYSLVDYDGYSNAISCTSTGTGNRGAGWYTKAGEIRAGETYTFSCRIKCSIATNIHTHTAWRNGSATATYTGWTSEGQKAISADAWTDYSFAFTPSTNAKLDWEFFVAICITGSSSGATYQIAHAKLERGNKATDWSPAPEDFASVTDSVEYIAGTQAAATGSWTGVTRDSSLYVGKTIAYKLPYAGSGNASLQLKDSSGNNVGGNIAVYSMTTRVTTHYPAGSVIQMTYDGTYWRTAGWYNSNNYDRNLHNNYVKAAANVTSGQLVCGTSAGYKPIAASVTFDMSYPILWAAGAWTSGTQYANAYETYPSVNPATTAAVESLGKNLMVYVKGQISGNTFTCAASNFLTCKVPTSEDGYFYLPIGIIANDATTKMYFNTSNDLYAYLDGKFRQVTPTEIVASHRIYYRRDTATKPSAPTSWIAEATSNVYNAWTTKVPPLAASTASGQTKYLYLYTCEQRKRLDGTIECTSVQLDENTIVTDGGSIIAYSLTAEKVDFAEATGTQLKLFDPGSPTNYTTIGSNGMDVVKGGTSVASFGDTTRIGDASVAHVEQTADATTFYGYTSVNGLQEALKICKNTSSNGAIYFNGGEARIWGSNDAIAVEAIGSATLHATKPITGTSSSIWSTFQAFINSDSNYPMAKINVYDEDGNSATLWVEPTSITLNAPSVTASGTIVANGYVGAAAGEALINGTSSYIYLRDETSHIIRISKTTGQMQYYDGSAWNSLIYLATTSRTANTVLAAPNGSDGVATFRKLVAADLPQTAWTYINSTASGDTNYVRWRYMSGMVTVQLNYANSAGLAAGTQKQFGTIATAAYRPDAAVTASAYLGSSTDHVASMWVDTSGRVYVRTLAAATAVFGTITYPLK